MENNEQIDLLKSNIKETSYEQLLNGKRYYITFLEFNGKKLSVPFLTEIK
jgi:hypothetical protein